MPKRMTPDELFEYLDPKWKWVTKDEDAACYLWEFMPEKCKNEWYNSGMDNYSKLEITIDFGTNDWTKCIAQRKPHFKAGMFGKCTDGTKVVYGYIRSLSPDKKWIYMEDSPINPFDNFQAMTEPKPLEDA